MTLREWLASRTPPPPATLRDRMIEMLGDDANADAAGAAVACLRAAARELRTIVDTKNFDRGGALDLLAIDALTTYAYEAAAAAGNDLGRLASDGLRDFGAIVTTHV